VRRFDLAAALLLSCLAAPAPSAAQQAPAPASADARLRELYTSNWAWMQSEAAALPGPGAGALADHWPRVDPASQQARLVRYGEVLHQLDTIPTAQLSAEEQVNAAVFRAIVEEAATDIRFRAYEAPFTSDSFFWSDLATRSGFENADEYRRYVGRLRDLPRYFDEQMANMRAGLARGFSIPRVTLAGRERTMEPFLVEGEANPLFAPFQRMPANIPAAEQAQLREAGLAAIREAAVPAYARLHAMFRDEYLPRARATLGASQLPDGEAYYRAMLRKYTTLDLGPREIHETGLREVARIRAEMEATMRRANFSGDLSAFIAFLRTDPQFYPRTAHEVLAEASYVVKRVDGRLRDFFATLPRYRHGIVPVPAEIAPIYTSARGGLDNCLFNTWNLPARPMYQLPALALHECTPGHSFQMALALEGPQRPEFRQQTYFSGYGEGWGLYVEGLGAEMGIYETPYQDFGRLSYEMWRASRLVIDTGIHAFGWTRERALQFLRDNTALSELELTNEVDRYISWPGQAPSYMLGALTIRRLRAEAERELGARFDIRAFHDAVLALGSVPLTTLEQRMRAFIAERRAPPR
jgi:uncharacterized protein (DUF885 family)